MWFEWNCDTECLFTEKELTKLRYRFGNPDVRRLHEFLKKTRPEEVDKSTLSLVQKIHDQFKECQMLAP